MISSARPAAKADSGAAPIAAAATTEPSAAPFDAVLALETLAANANAAQADLAAELCPEGGFDALQDELLADDEGVEDSDDAALDALAMLGLLITPATTPQASQTQSAQSQGADDSAADAVDDALASPPNGTGSALLSNTDLAARVADSAATDKLLNAAAAVDGSTDGTTSADSASSARANEWVTHGVRHSQGAERAAITTHVRDPRWAEEFGTRIALMVRGGESSASLQLTPVDLGPLEVSVTVRDGQASIHFGAAQAETRALLEASIPRLREMLAAQGFNLMDASVSQGFSRQARHDAPLPAQREAEAEAESRAITRIESTRLLDTYA